MKFPVQNNLEEIINAKRVLQKGGFSQRLISRIKHEGQLLDDADRRIDFTDKVMPFESFWIELPDEVADPTVATSSEPLEIIFENENWLVVNKPAGLTAVPGPSNQTDTLVNRIKGHWQSIDSVNMVPHLITRLDRYTSGVTLVARHLVANSLLSQQVKHHQIQKEYIALVAGVVDADHGRIDQPLGLAADGIHREIQVNGQAASTEFEVLERYEKATLVKVHLITGRTHQIRVHFKSLGHPLIGDELYGGPLDFGINRQALHAQKIEFIDPFTTEKLNFEAPIPADLATLIQKLRS